MPRKNITELSPELQLEIFEMVFLYMLDYVLMREKLASMIESRDRVDNAELDLKLRKLELELLKKGGVET